MIYTALTLIIFALYVWEHLVIWLKLEIEPVILSVGDLRCGLLMGL